MPDPSAKGSSIIAYTNLCPGRNLVLANHIRQLLYIICQPIYRHGVGSFVGYHWTHCDFARVSSECMARMSCTGKTMRIGHFMLHLSHCQTTDDIFVRVNCNYAIVTFLWHSAAYTIIPDVWCARLALLAVLVSIFSLHQQVVFHPAPISL